MHIIKAHEPAVTLFARNGDVRVFRSRAHALKQLGMSWIRENVAADFKVFLHPGHRLLYNANADRPFRESIPVYRNASFIMRDDTGARLTAIDFRPLQARRTRMSRYGRMLDTWNGDGPVPGIHRQRRWPYFRRIRTARDLRLAAPVDDEPMARAKRNATNIPTSWDDIGRGSYRVRSWKHYRYNQWKA